MPKVTPSRAASETRHSIKRIVRRQLAKCAAEINRIIDRQVPLANSRKGGLGRK